MGRPPPPTPDIRIMTIEDLDLYDHYPRLKAAKAMETPKPVLTLPTETPTPEPTPTTAAPEPLTGDQVSLVGDSVSLASAPALEASLPGIAIGMLAAALRFGLHVHTDIATVAAILGAQFTTVSIGYAIAFWLPPNGNSLATQVIMIGGLLFSPITFPAERLPEWAIYLHQFLPFVPLGDIIREAAFRTGSPQALNVAVVASWALVAYNIAYIALRKRS